MKPTLLSFLSLSATLFLLGGCSVKKMAMNQIGDALSGGGTVFSSDEDPELVKDALPFSLKLMESVLAETPKHQGLLTAFSWMPTRSRTTITIERSSCASERLSCI
jgi:hypothetical protein